MSEQQRQDSARQALKNLRMRLLDLTARNRLINFRHTKGASLRIIDELPDQLVEALLAETEMRFQAVPEPTRKQLIKTGYVEINNETGQEVRLKPDPGAEEWARGLNLKTSFEVPASSGSTDEEHEGKHTDNAIQTLLFPYELETRLRGLRQKAESAIEETGANILYLAVGFLEWYDNNDSDNGRLAPLFLVPVRLHKGRLNRKTKTYEYTLSYSGEDIIPNLSLREKLRVDFAMALPELDEDTRPEAYLASVLDLIQSNQPHWCLRRYITLGLLNFSKLLMYLDLDASRWPNGRRITDHSVVSHFLAGYNGEQDEKEAISAFGFGEEYAIDDMPDVHAKYPLIDDADSSQHSALVDAVNGKNLVIEGPPGTGKSQTITNLIAAAMAQGKKVLFMAEKLAALEVVKRRLDAAGLGDFCLELHSHKSQKRKVLDDVTKRLQMHGAYRKPHEIAAEITRYEELKVELKHHVERINCPWKQTGRTVHEIFMAATRYREALGVNPTTLHPQDYDGDNFDAAIQRRTRDQVVAFGDVYRAIVHQLEGNGSQQRHPWSGVHNTEIQIFDIERVSEALEGWQAALQQLAAFRHDLGTEFGCNQAEIPNTLSGLHQLLEKLQCLPSLEGDELLDCLPMLRGERLDQAKEYLKLFEAIQSRYTALSKNITPEVLENLALVDRFLSGRQQLQQLVGETVELGELSDAIQRLNRLQDQLLEIKAPLSAIQSAIGEEAGKHLRLSESGLRELQVFIETVTMLQPAHWKLRDDLFDNDELDQVLPRLRGELETLHALREQLAATYNLDNLPHKFDLLQLKNTLEDGGFFRWFRGSWRNARKSLLNHAVNTQIKYSAMLPLLDKAVAFAGERKQFDNDPVYHDLLGEHVKGLDTDVSSLESVRQWYRHIRKTYGVGFGPNVALGNALIALQGDLARAIRSLSEQGVGRQLEQMLDELTDLKMIFSPIPEIQSGDSVLVGEGGLFGKLLNSLKQALQDCTPLRLDNTLTVADLSKRIEALNILRKAVTNWTKSDFDTKLFKGKLGLQIGLGKDNDAALSAAHHTLYLAACLDHEIAEPLITRRVYDQPDRATFEALYTMAEQLRAVLNEQAKNCTTFEECVELDFAEWTNGCGDSVVGLIERNVEALSHGQALTNWLDYVRVRDQLLALGFGRLVASIEESVVPIERVEEAYYAGVYDVLAREILHELPELSRFSGHTQEALQRQFREYDNRLKKLQCEKIAWRIDQTKVPRGNSGGRVSEYTEGSLLEHECGKKTRHIPLRQLLKRASGALVGLKPCFMMGPMSVAHYLAPGQIEFDMVVMDEASQIKPEDALGAVARGAQLVVVGDPKQLPPTSFFDRMVDDEKEDLTAIEESESILDATLPMFPARRLRWHYRSQHESLIAFSNHSFYESNLVLFPSPHNKSEDFGLQYKRLPNGCFVNRRNLEEAKVISEAVREHFQYRPEETLGVVAMSAEQRDQIERSVEMLAKEDTAFQVLLEKDQSRQESLFTKNLENVQGDERDVIFISMTYGPQEPGGRVFQRFGPINSDVGWRRLNVLFTRSRKRMHIFSSMGSEDIVIGPNAKRGVKALRDFLAYGETGILHHTEAETERAPDSDFEVAVADALRKEGFECVPQVGVAGFFIDIAVQDPGNPGRYLMGVECDGATYHSAKSVRDRDRLRQTILERLGWRIRRIWSTDWFKNPQAELKAIVRELHELKTYRQIACKPQIKSGADEIEDIIRHVEKRESVVDHYVLETNSLKEKLIEFDREVIRKALPNTPGNQRLLRPAMLDALLEYTPTSKWEFLEKIPMYLRQATAVDEGEYLDQIFEIINAASKEVEFNRDA